MFGENLISKITEAKRTQENSSWELPRLRQQETIQGN